MAKRETRCFTLESITAGLEDLRRRETLDFATRKVRVLFVHFLFGVLRGMGFALGFSTFSAVVVVALRHLMLENIPLIGGFLAELVNAILQRL